jgi:hypothetical protein
MSLLSLHSLGEVPPLFDILWNMPTLKDVHVIDRLAATLMDTRKKATGGHEDISSHLVRRGSSHFFLPP